MSPQDREELERQAGEYALGTLSGEERARFERALGEHVWLQQAVDAWNHRLGPLAEAVAPMSPSPSVWSRIEARIAAETRAVPREPSPTSLLERIAFWRWSAIGAAAVAALLLVYVTALPRGPAADHVAVLTNPQGSPAVIVVADAGQRALTVRALADAPSGHTHELWIIPGVDQKPRSLGTTAVAGTARLAIPADLAAAVANATIAVSLEPPGGSPTGQPTGPVLYTGRMLTLPH
jgi:anti-sigma-K factor RskA